MDIDVCYLGLFDVVSFTLHFLLHHIQAMTEFKIVSFGKLLKYIFNQITLYRQLSECFKKLASVTNTLSVITFNLLLSRTRKKTLCMERVAIIYNKACKCICKLLNIIY